MGWDDWDIVWRKYFVFVYSLGVLWPFSSSGVNSKLQYHDYWQAFHAFVKYTCVIWRCTVDGTHCQACCFHCS